MQHPLSHRTTHLVLVHPHGAGRRAVVPLIALEFVLLLESDVAAVARELIAIRLQVSPDSFLIEVQNLAEDRRPTTDRTPVAA